MAAPMETEKTPHPLDISLLGAYAVVLMADGFPNAVEQGDGLIGFHAVFGERFNTVSKCSTGCFAV